jgi:hypothetical protein
MNNTNEFRAEWAVDKTFEEGSVLVLVSKSNHRSPRYQIEVSFRGTNGPVRSYRPYTQKSNGKVTFDLLAPIVARLYAEAENYVADMFQLAEDEWIEKQISRANQNDRGKEARPGLKALAKQDKAKHEAKVRHETGDPSQQ